MVDKYPAGQRNPGDYGTADEKIAAAIHNETYVKLAFGSGATDQHGSLLLDNVERAGVDTASLSSLIDKIGWPDENDDREVKPQYGYKNSEDFLYYMFGQGSVDDQKSLNDLNNLFRAKPAQLDDEGRRIGKSDSLVGASPFLLRAYALAPDLMAGLHEALQGTDSGRATKEVYAANPQLVAAAYMAYTLMGRLVKASDNETLYRIEGYDKLPGVKAEPITSAHKVLAG